ncbi:MAG TPA: hypothetical protein VFP35_00095 [Candidatus Saccharimonadales bacterium]|nr:hypothetical protein [Candidatus Saccharimonadales bacterium]
MNYGFEFYPSEGGGSSDDDDEELLRRDLEGLGLNPNTNLDDGPDTDSTEDALERFNLNGEHDEEEVEPYERPVLVESIAREVSNRLAGLTLRGAEGIETEIFLELCEKAGITPEPRGAAIAFTDLLIEMERRDYMERSMTFAPTLSDLAQACEVVDDIDELQKGRTLVAYRFLSNFMKDPILELPIMEARRQELEVEQADSFERYEQIESELKELNDRINSLTAIEEVRERRESAVRCMDWLLRQDYLIEFAKQLRTALKKGKPVDFVMVAGALAGNYDIAGGERVPGVIERLLEEHRESMEDTTQKTERQMVRDETKLRRLEQAMAICQYVFAQDIAERIYAGSPISPAEFRKLEFIRERLYVNGDTSVLDKFIGFLPGSPLQNTEEKEIYDVALPKKFSGRSLMELFGEIDMIINQHPDLDIDRITELVEAKNAGLTTDEHDAELAIYALKILEKLAYQENYSVRGLVSEN